MTDLMKHLIGARPQSGIVSQKATYPVVQPDAEMLAWFKQNPKVAGMAYGAGLNGSSKDDPRTVIVNPYTGMSKEQEGYLVDNERLRHFMDEKDITPSFQPTENQVGSFQGSEYGKPENSKFLKQTLVSRILTGDDSMGDVTDEQRREANRIAMLYQKEKGPLSFFSGAEPSLPSMVMDAIKLRK